MSLIPQRSLADMLFSWLPQEYREIAAQLTTIIVIILAAIIVDRVILRHLKKNIKKLDIDINTFKSFIFFVRVIIAVMVILAIASTQFIPSEYLIGTSALLGTAIGFGATKALSNFISGAYVLISGLLRIGDYVKIGNDEGIVSDMTVNYTKIRRSDGATVIFSNADILGKTIVNYRTIINDEAYYSYPIQFKADRSFSPEKVSAIIEQIKKKFPEIVNISYSVASISKSDVEYNVVILVKKGEDILKMKPIVLKTLLEAK